MIKRISKKWILTLATMIFAFFAALTSAGAFVFYKQVSADVLEPNASVAYDYTFAFNAYDASNWSGESAAWKEDAYEYDNLRLSPGQFPSLAPGEERKSNPLDARQDGYVVYHVTAPSAERALHRLNVSLVGRSFHYAHASDSCGIKISVKKSLTDEWEQAAHFPAQGNSGSAAVYSAELTEYVQGGNDCFVRIDLTGYENDWVCLQKIEFSGELSYLGYEVVEIAIEGGERPQTVTRDKDVAIRSAVASTSTQTYAYTTEVYAPDGTSVTVTDGNFLCDALGEYTVRYIVDDEGGIYEREYCVYCVENSDESGYVLGNYGEYDKSAFLDLNNYAVSEENALRVTQEGNLSLNGSAYYLLPISFARDNFNLAFDVKNLPKGGSFDFAFCGAPGEVNFDTKSAPGVYFNLKSESEQLLVSAAFSDGEKTVGLGIVSYTRINGVHGIGLNRRTITYTDGMGCYFDGEEYNSYSMAVDVYLSKITSGENVYVSYRTVNSDIELHSLVKADSRSPVLSVAETLEPYREYPNTVKVNDTFVLPNAVMYDLGDGIMSHTVRVVNPNGKEVVLVGTEELSFTADYVGRYSIYYTASDYNGNSITTRKNVTASVKENAPDFSFSKEVAASGRVGEAVKLPIPRVLVDTVEDETLAEDVKITVVHPTGGEIQRKPGEFFTPFGMGIYSIVYSVSNDYGTAYKYFEINVKANVDEEDSYFDFINAENWSAQNAVVSVENGIKIIKPAYCVLPFEMSNGIEVTMDLAGLADKSKVDCWTSLGVGSSKAFGDFGTPTKGFVYFMFYYENGTYFCNGNYCNEEGVTMGLFGPIDMGTTGTVTIGIEKLSGNATLSDNVNVYLNHKRTDYGTESLIVYSSIVDDENFTYLSIGSYGNSGDYADTEYKSMRITAVSKCDQTAPQFLFDGKNADDYKFEEKTLGDTVSVPTITVEEDFDKNFKYAIGLYAPTGEKVDYENGFFVADTVGTYYLVLKAYDKSGNSNYQVKEIVVTKPKKGCSSTASVSSTLVCLATLFFGQTCVRFARKKKRREGENS